MSDYLAVGGVSAVLQWMLANSLTSGGPSTLLGSTSPGVTVLSPDLISTGQDEQPQLNLFMYYVSLNATVRNLDLPSTGANGQALNKPPLALNLHYLVTAYGAGSLDTEVLLAWAIKVFHDTPVVPSVTITDALGALASANPAAAIVAGSTLAAQIERLRITPETLTTEEIYRLWTAFQTAYRPSTAFQVSVVVIQDTGAVASGPPVQTTSILVNPNRAPEVDSITPSRAVTGAQLRLTGRNFLGGAGTTTTVSFDSGVTVAPDSVGPDRLVVTLPAALQAGTRRLRVQRSVVFPGESTAHPGTSSTPAPFQLLPTIENASPVAVTQGSDLALTITPAVGRSQQAFLQIGHQAISIEPRPAGSAPSTTLRFPITTDVPPGLHPISVVIDGAQSLLSRSGASFIPQAEVST